MEADGKICPYSLNVLLAPVPCSFGSQALFTDEEARTHAEQTFHKYEWGSLHLLKAAELTPASKLALRIITTIQPNNVKEVVKQVKNNMSTTKLFLTETENEKLESDPMDENEKIRKKAINLLALGIS